MSAPPLPTAPLRAQSDRASCLHHLLTKDRGRLTAFDVIREDENWNVLPLRQSWFAGAIGDAVPFVFPSASGLIDVAADGEPQILDSTEHEEIEVLEGRRPVPFARTCFEVILPSNPWFLANNVAEYRICLLAERGPFPDVGAPPWMSGQNGITFAHFHATKSLEGRWRGIFNGAAGHLAIATDGTPGFTYVSVFNGTRPQERLRVDGARCLLERLLAELAAPRNERVHVPAAPRLNAARSKKGKPVIPDRYVVDVRPRTTNSLGQERKGHASPQPHMRRRHVRRLASGQEVIVRECIVNAASRGEVGTVEYRVLNGTRD